MNVIVSNKQKGIIDNANIDAIKDLNGLFNVNDLINKFKNYFFSKMILDATSIIDFASREVLQKLVDEIGADRLVILLPATPEPPVEFKKLLVDLKIYNFSNKVEDIVKFIEKPNTYENVMNTIMDTGENTNEFYVDNSIKEGEDINTEVSDANTSSNDYNNVDNEVSGGSSNNSFHASLGDIMNKISVGDMKDSYDSEDDNNHIDLSKIDSVDENIDNNYHEETNSMNLVNDSISNVNSTRKSFLNMDGFDIEENITNKAKRIIGVKNITEHAGSTTLIYMLQHMAKKNNRDILSIEINKNDFRLFRSSKMISIQEDKIEDAINSNKEEIMLIDLNDCKDDSFCSEILYLVEPSIIKLNKLMMENKLIFNDLHDKKVILNKSLLDQDDIKILEEEAGMKFFFNVVPVNDRNDNKVIEELLNNLLAN